MKVVEEGDDEGSDESGDEGGEVSGDHDDGEGLIL